MSKIARYKVRVIKEFKLTGFSLTERGIEPMGFVTKEEFMDSKNQPLFGKQDLIVNTLSVEIVEIKEQIKSTINSIENKKENLKNLEERRTNLEESLKLAKSQVGVGAGDIPEKGKKEKVKKVEKK